ncbi:hypothetical protein BJV78DRAFT_1157059 [Lactifluus subvellereus]|nr:hypothetical protein BJV78DRAFT_1157059 [Lactifluus subvellereus]
MSSPVSLSTFGTRVGPLLLAETSAVSACAIICLLSYIAYSAVSIIRGSSRRWSIGGPAEVYFLNQLAWDLVQAAGESYDSGGWLCSLTEIVPPGGLMNIKWAMDGLGAVKHVSDVGCALSTLCFMKVPHHDDQLHEEKTRRKRLHRSLIVVVCIWAGVALIVGINVAVNGAGHFYGPTEYWCWIPSEFKIQRTACDFGLMWMTAAANIVIYAILFLYFRGYITTSGWRIHTSRRPEPVNIHGPLKQAFGLLLSLSSYPLVYILTVLPLSIARYRDFAHHSVPSAGTIFVDIIYLSSGLLNVILFSTTRPFLLPHDPPTSDTTSETRYDIRLADVSQRDNSDVGVSPQAHNFRHVESPANRDWPRPGSAHEGRMRASEVLLDEKLGAENASIHSLGW